MTRHCVPSQRAEKGWLPKPPTAQTFVVENTFTAVNEPSVGVGTTVQAAPSQWIARLPRFEEPTAQTSLRAAPSTAERPLNSSIVLIFISLFLAVAQERSQFIDRLALQPARVQIPAYVLAFLTLELFPATGPVPFVYFQF